MTSGDDDDDPVRQLAEAMFGGRTREGSRLMLETAAKVWKIKGMTGQLVISLPANEKDPIDIGFRTTSQ